LSALSTQENVKDNELEITKMHLEITDFLTEMKERYEMIKHDALLDKEEFDEKLAKIQQSLPKYSIISRNSITPRTILNKNGLLTVHIEFPVVRDENFDELQIIIVPDLDKKTIIDVNRKYICVNYLTHQYFYPKN
jgi:hypothetical protein